MRLSDFIFYTLILALGVVLFILSSFQWDFLGLIVLLIAVLGGSGYLIKHYDRP